MKYFRDNLATISILGMAYLIVLLVYAPITNASAIDNDHVVITVKESPADVDESGVVLDESESLENVCLSIKLAMLLRTDLKTGEPKSAKSLPQVTYFPMLDGVRVNHFNVLYDPTLTCNVEGTVYTLGQLLGMLDVVFGVDVQVCWECWISRYGFPVAGDNETNPVYGGIEYGDGLNIFLNKEKMAIQDMFNKADKIIDFD